MNKFWIVINLFCSALWGVDFINYIQNGTMRPTAYVCSMIICIFYFLGEALKGILEEERMKK